MRIITSLGVIFALMSTGCGHKSSTEATLVQVAPKALNARGMVVGGLRPAVDALPAFIAIDGKRRELKPPPGTAWALPQAINAAGQIVGYATEEAMQTKHAYIWKPLGESVTDPTGSKDRPAGWKVDALPDGGATSSEATAINASGDAVGTRWDADGISHPCLWHQGKCFDLGTSKLLSSHQRQETLPVSYVPFTPPRGVKITWYPTGINRNGEVVGWGIYGIRGIHLYHFVPNKWRYTNPESVGVLEGHLVDLGMGRMIAINDRGDIVRDDLTHRMPGFQTCLWRRDVSGPQIRYQREDLPNLPDCKQSFALALNNRGQIVGQSNRGLPIEREGQASTGEPTPVLWEHGKAIDLRTRLVAPFDGVLEEGIAINDAGQILCTGRQGIWGCAVLLTPKNGTRENISRDSGAERRYSFQVF